MKTISPSLKIYISDSNIPKAGRGVFASQDIKKDEVIEICPVIVFPKDQTELFQKTLLHNYYFSWGEQSEMVAINLGYGTLYNHSYKTNALYIKNFDQEIITISAYTDIKKDEEITINYNGKPDDQSKNWLEGMPATFDF